MTAGSAAVVRIAPLFSCERPALSISRRPSPRCLAVCLAASCLLLMIAGIQLFLSLSASGSLQVSTLPAHAHSHEAVLRSRILRFGDLHVNVSHPAPAPTSRGCIIFLVASAQEDVSELLLGLRNLHAYYTAAHATDILIFHEAGFAPFQQDILDASGAAERVHFVDASAYLIMPSSTLRQLPWWIGDGYHWALHKRGLFSYGRMCRFFAGAAIHHPVFDSYEYYWRMDTDSRITGPIPYDVFDHMAATRKLYGYSLFQEEDGSMMQGLVAAAQQYAELRFLRPTFLRELQPPAANGNWFQVWTNFEVVSIPFMRSLEVQDFFGHLDAAHGFFQHRWGDAPVRLLQLALFTELSSLHRFCDVPYSHGYFHTDGDPACARQDDVLLADPQLAAALGRHAKRRR